MKDDWVIAELLDLTEFSKNNGLPGLADELEIARLISLMEMKQTYYSLHVARKHTVII
tara:strand:- start:324 stop:497 length:174 start_codon:yes stop_codon:yes gene_type:complete